MKKLFVLFLSLVLTIMMFPSMAFASSDMLMTQESKKVKVNEYDLIEALSKETPSELTKKGYSAEEIQKIKNYKSLYKEHIIKMSKLSDDVLKKLRYTDKQIEVIRNFSGSVDEMRRASVTLQLEAFPTNFKKDGNYTTGEISFFWSMNGIPLFRMTDIVGISWNGWAVTSKHCNVWYYDINSGQTTHVKSATSISPKVTAGSLAGAGFKFNLVPDYTYSCALYGEGSWKVRSDVQAKKDFYYYIAYGHNEYAVSVGFSVSATGPSVGLDFNLGYNEMDSKSGRVIPK